MASIKLKRGDTQQISFTISKQFFPDGSMAYFMAKPAPDDDINDTAAVVHIETYEAKRVDDGKVRLTFNVLPEYTKNVSTDGAGKVTFKGEVEVRTSDGRVHTMPGGDKFIDVIIYADIRRGGNG